MKNTSVNPNCSHDIDELDEDDLEVGQSSSEEELHSEDTVIESDNQKEPPSIKLSQEKRPIPLSSDATPFVQTSEAQASAQFQPNIGTAQRQPYLAEPQAQNNNGAVPPEMIFMQTMTTLATSMQTKAQQAAASIQSQTDQITLQQNFQCKMLIRQKITDQKTALAEAKAAIKPMRDDSNICKYIEHFEFELTEANIPIEKWKKILVSKLSHKIEKKCSHLTHDYNTTYGNLKHFLLKHVGPSTE